MAYLVNKSVEVGASSSLQYTLTLPSHQQNDLILIFVDTKFNVYTAPTGYTEDVSTGGIKVFSRYETGTPAATATMAATASSAATAIVVAIVRDAASTGYVDTSATRASSSGATMINPAVTPTAANTMVFSAFSQDSNTYCGLPYDTMIHIGSAINGSNASINLGYIQHTPASTSTGTFEYIPGGYSTSLNPAGVTIAIKDSGSGNVGTYFDWNAAADRPVTMLHRSGDGFLSGALATADWDPTSTGSSVITTINSLTTYKHDCTYTYSQSDYFNTASRSESSSANKNKVYLDGATLGSTHDLTGEILLMTHYFTGLGYANNQQPHSVFGISDGTNARIWALGGKDALPNMSRGIYPTLIDMNETSLAFQNYGTFDITSCSKFVVGARVGNTFENQTFGPIYKMQTMKILGGTSTIPSSFSNAQEIAEANGYFSVQAQGGQTIGQFFCLHNIQIGNGGSDSVYWDSTNQSVEYPSAPDLTNFPVRPQALIGSARLSLIVDAGTGKTVILANQVFNMGDYHNIKLLSGNLTGSSNVVLNATPTVGAVDNALGGWTFSGCKEITLNSGFDLSGGCTVNGCVDAQAVTITSEADYAKLANCTFTNNAVAIKITGNQSHTGSGWADAGLTVSGNTYDIEYTGATNFSIQSAATLNVLNSGAGTLTVVTPTNDLTLTSSETGTLLQIFTTGTQTVIDSTTGSSLVYTHSGETVDVVAQKAGFLPQRQTGIVLSGDVGITFNLVADPVYDSGHGLTYTTDASWDRATNRLTVPTFGPTVRQVYSLLIDSFISQTSLRNTPFNISMNGPSSMFLTKDAEGAADSSIQNMTGGGVRYVNTSGTTTAEWSGIEDKGTGPGANTGEYQQVDGSGTTDARASGKFNELIKVYGDASHGNFDYRGHLVLKYQINGYKEERIKVPSLYGISTLEPTLYVVSMNPEAINAVTGDPALASPPTITDHGATPVSWNGRNFSITITDSAGGNSAVEILRHLNYSLRGANDTTFNGKDPFNWPEMVVEEGSNYATVRGYTEGAQSTTLKGVRVVQNDGTTAHAGFARFQSDDGTYFVPLTVAQISVPNVTAGRIQVYNQTAAALSAWQATTAYSEGDRVLRTTGLGSDLGDGVFFVCTTAGTSGGTEPTWDVASDGNTTTDGTVTWTVRPVEFANTTTTAGYSSSWTDGEHFTSGDVIRVRWTDEDDSEILSTGVATTDGTTTFLDSPVTDSVYTAYGIDGSTVTEYSADYPNIQVDVNDPDNVFYLDRFYAWYKYNLTTADGIRNFFGAVTATNTSNITINNSVVDIFFDNTKSVSARQGDTIVIQRADGAYPQVTTTSGGGGLGFYYAGIGYSTSSGSGLDTTERNKLLGLRDFNPESDAIEGVMTYQEAQRIILAESAGKVAVSGTTVTFRDQADTKNRITATVDSNGQRTSVTTDGS